LCAFATGETLRAGMKAGPPSEAGWKVPTGRTPTGRDPSGWNGKIVGPKKFYVGGFKVGVGYADPWTIRLFPPNDAGRDL
jgi:hypothetical protein